MKIHHEIKLTCSELCPLKGESDFELLAMEVYQGKLAYRSKGSHKRITWRSIKKGLLKKEVLLYLPF